MAGLLILALIGGYIYLAWWAIQKPRAMWMKALLLLAFILIPTADAVYGRIKLKQLCEKEGGLKSFRIVENVRGFYGEFALDEFVRDFGYEYVERDRNAGLVTRVTKRGGRIVLEERVPPISRFAYRSLNGNLSDVYMKREIQIVDNANNQVLGISMNFLYAGGWVERAIAGLIASRGDGGSCQLGDPLKIIVTLVTTILKPSPN